MVSQQSAHQRSVQRSRQNRAPGRAVRIDLGNGRVAFGRQLLGTEVEFYDREFDENEPVDLLYVVSLPIAFRICVVNVAFSRNGSWTLLDVVALSDQERNTVARYAKQDPISGRITIYWHSENDGTSGEEPASVENCQGLERFAVWSAVHVEDRLRDHFAGRANKYVESMRIRG